MRDAYELVAASDLWGQQTFLRRTSWVHALEDKLCQEAFHGGGSCSCVGDGRGPSFAIDRLPGEADESVFVEERFRNKRLWSERGFDARFGK
jgi:hypothetical protein